MKANFLKYVIFTTLSLFQPDTQYFLFLIFNDQSIDHSMATLNMQHLMEYFQFLLGIRIPNDASCDPLSSVSKEQ